MKRPKKTEESMLDLEPRVSIGARKMAKAIAHDVWQKYDDTYGYRTEKQERNAKVSVYDADCMIFFFGQFDPTNQNEFIARLMETTHFKFRNEIADWIKAYYGWYHKDEAKI